MLVFEWDFCYGCKHECKRQPVYDDEHQTACTTHDNVFESNDKTCGRIIEIED